MSEWRYQWRRLKLNIAELLVLSLAERGRGSKYVTHILGAAHGIRVVREAYYPDRRQKVRV